MRAKPFLIPPPPQLHPALACGVAVGLPLVALAVQHALRPWVEPIPFVLFFFVVSIASSVGGWVPGLVCVAVSAASGWTFISSSPEPQRAAGAAVGTAVFLPVAAAIAALGALVRAGFRERESAMRELAGALRARDEFISAASHELKTPLTALTLTSYQLAHLVPRASSDPRLQRLVTAVARQTSRLDVLVTNLLDVSRIRSRRLHLELSDVDLGGVVREVASRFEAELAHSGSTLALRLDGPVVGRWDRLRVEQVVTNLLSNAVKYGAGRPIEIAASLRGDAAVLRVADAGIGIRIEDQARIFERFERAVHSDPQGGFGIGLWIVREIAAALDGEVRVESAPGEGTTFFVVLPLRGPGRESRAPVTPGEQTSVPPNPRV
jgi:signal transduction histidine kinase